MMDVIEEESIELNGLEEITPEIEKEEAEITDKNAPTSFFNDEEEDESISLSGNELENIFQDAEIVEESQPDTEEVSSERDSETLGIEETTETVTAAEVSGPKSDSEEDAALSPELIVDGKIDKDNLKTIIKYLDDLLDNLPKDKIKEFAQSEYYDLYIKLLDNLDI